MSLHQPILVFDLETFPDIATGKKLYPELAPLSDDDAMTAMVAIREAEAGNSFMRQPLHKIACLSFLWVELDKAKFSLHSLTLENHSEDALLSKFFRAFDKAPQLLSWNGAGFDLPVLLYRSLHHRLSCPQLFNQNKTGYFNRYSAAHVDLMDKFSAGQYANKHKLDTIAALCGYAGKAGINGSMVAPMVKAGQWQALATYCESDVINTWLLFLRWQLLTGQLDSDDVLAIEQDTFSYLASLTDSDGTPRHSNFLPRSDSSATADSANA